MKYFFLLFLFTTTIFSQNKTFTTNDTIRGTINENRAWWDVIKYDLDITVDIKNKSISGTNKISYKVVDDLRSMQIDLQPPMRIVEVRQNNTVLPTNRIGNHYSIDLKNAQIKDSTYIIEIKFDGTPKETDNAPWKGGFTWTKDDNGYDFVGTSCQGDGASLWWPCKDHLSDEPDNGMEISYTVPSHLTAIGNGRLIDTELDTIKNTKTYNWKVINPINNYAVSLAIGNYVNYQKNYVGEAGILDCDFYVLKHNFSKAKTQFLQVEKMLKAFEYWFGPYPFYEDSYKIIEAPFLGMEHQSAISYGNNFQNGYRGSDLSGTGWGLNFDFIIIHESGHEWFGNNITNNDIADMWIHESFTNYSESLYLNYYYGKKAASEYTIGIRKNIKNDIPIIGEYNVNNRGSDDMYYKGANMLHTIRYSINNDQTWRQLLRSLNHTFYHKTVSSKEIETYISNFTKIDFSSVFDQYLRTTEIPTLEYKLGRKYVKYRWINCIPNFNLKIHAKLNNGIIELPATTEWKKLKAPKKIIDFSIDTNYYINTQEEH